MSHFFEFGAWHAICARVGDVGGKLAWVAYMLKWRACVSGVLVWVACLRSGVLAWVAYLRANVGGMGDMLTWVACYYYCYCYC